MNLEQARSTEQLKVMYHALSQKMLTIDDNGSVSTEDKLARLKKYQCMSFTTVESPRDKPVVFSIYNPHTKRYLCFDKAGNLKGKRKCTPMCHFYERTNEGPYIEYKLAEHCRKHTPIVAFTKEGKPQKKRNKKHNMNALILPMRNYCPKRNETNSLRHHRCRPRPCSNV